MNAQLINEIQSIGTIFCMATIFGPNTFETLNLSISLR